MPAHGLEAFVDAALIGLRAALGKASHDSLSIFIDPTLTDPVRDAVIVVDALHKGSARSVRLPRVHDNIDPGATPYLLHVRSERESERLVAFLVRLAIEEALSQASPLASVRSVCAWIVGDDLPETRAQQLAEVARIRQPDGTLWPMRFWDPRVMWHLSRALPANHWRRLRGALGSWMTLDMQQQLTTVPTFAPEAGEARTPMHFDESNWPVLQRIGAVNMVLALAQQWGLQPTEDNARRADRLLATCAALGFESERDGQVFAACGLTSHDRFYEHPEVQADLQHAAKHGQSVKTALMKFDDIFWSSLADGWEHGPRPALRT